MPLIPVPESFLGPINGAMQHLNATKGDLCIQPILFHKEEMESIGEYIDGDAVYKVLPPEPKDGHWVAYYVEVVFPGDEDDDMPWDITQNEYKFSTPGYTWP